MTEAPKRFRALVKHDGKDVGDLPWLEEFWAVRYEEHARIVSEKDAEIARLTAERDAIAALTVERCADVALARMKTASASEYTQAEAREDEAMVITLAIRALSPVPPHVAAARVLERLEPDELRPILSALADHTPATCYYSRSFAEVIPEIAKVKGGTDGDMTPLTQGLMLVAAAASSSLAIGDKMQAEFVSLMSGESDLGSFRLSIERLALMDQENSNG